MTTTPSSELPIGVFDSGVGGLTVLKAIAEALPEEDDDILLDMIDEEIISLEVVNLDTGVSTNLADGERLDDGSSPSGPGEYVLSLNDARNEPAGRQDDTSRQDVGQKCENPIDEPLNRREESP